MGILFILAIACFVLYIAFCSKAKRAVPRTSSVMACSHDADYVILDVETTGLDPFNDKIIQLSAIKYNSAGAPVDFYNTYLNPGRSIPASASRINGITDAKVSDAPTAEQVQDQFLAFLGDTLIVGYNVRFDLRFLVHTFPGSLHCRQYVDVLSIVRALLSLPSYKLENVSSSIGFTPAGSFHDSFTDCEAVASILAHLNEDLSPWIDEFIADKPTTSRIQETASFDSIPGIQRWIHGEDERKKGNIEEALQLFDQAKAEGCKIPILFLSYAMAYRKAKNLESEIAILEEGLTVCTGQDTKELEARKNRAQELLEARQRREEISRQKDLVRAQKAEARQIREEQKKSKPSQPIGCPVVQCSDDGSVIQTYPTIAAASRAVGVSPKGIRSALSGHQKHAGGYLWRYESAMVSSSLEDDDAD